MTDSVDHVRTWLTGHLKIDEGAASVEYGVMVALIAAVIIGTVATIGGQLNTAFQAVSTALSGA